MSYLIDEKPAKAAESRYDLIIVGGGIYGIMLAWEASKNRLKTLLLERDNFGEHTSSNSLRIIHGGLRYLQKLDLHRFNESVRERSWFLRNFPEQVKPLPCLMPLYNQGIKRSSIFKMALFINHLLSKDRNNSLPIEQHLPAGGTITKEQVKEIFPLVDSQNLAGGAIWYDAWMLDSQEIFSQVLKKSSANGAKLLNNIEATSLITRNNKTAGIWARDEKSGKKIPFMAPVVINSAGPWCREVAEKFHKDESHLFRPSLAWNILFNREAPSSHALAVTPKKADGHTYFLVPCKGKLMAGTGHAPWFSPPQRQPRPTEKQLDRFIEDINLGIPGLNLSLNEINRILAGFLPVAAEGQIKLTNREIIYDHCRNGGPEGFYSLSGIKFTTARLVAEKALRRIYGKNSINNKQSPSI